MWTVNALWTPGFVLCVGLDIRDFVMHFKVGLILTGMSKIGGNARKLWAVVRIVIHRNYDVFVVRVD